jgi:hypothetical protein
MADGSALTALALLLSAPLIMNPAAAKPELHRTHVIKVQTDDAEVIEADVSHLQPGEAEMIVTENGTTVDLIRTDAGMEIWIDGELVDSASTAEAALVRARLAQEEGGTKFIFSEDVEIDCRAEDDEHCLHEVLIARHMAGHMDGESLSDLAEQHGTRVIWIETEEHVEEQVKEKSPD